MRRERVRYGSDFLKGIGFIIESPGFLKHFSKSGETDEFCFWSWGRVQHPGYYQVPVLADNRAEQGGDVCLYQLR